MEKLHVEKQSANADKVKRYKSYGEFAKGHQCEGLDVSVVGNHHFGRCRICIEHVDQLRKSKSCVFSDTWIHGKKIDSNRTRDWNRHIDSAMHKEARLLKSQPKIGGAFGAAALEAKSLTLNFLRLIYSAFRMSLPYRQIIRLMTTLKECGFDIGNRNHDEKAAAETVTACMTPYLARFDGSFQPLILAQNVIENFQPQRIKALNYNSVRSSICTLMILTVDWL